MTSEQVQYFAEEMMDLGGKSDAKQKYDHDDDNGPDILSLFGGKHVFRGVFHFSFRGRSEFCVNVVLHS